MRAEVGQVKLGVPGWGLAGNTGLLSNGGGGMGCGGKELEVEEREEGPESFTVGGLPPVLY